MSKPSFTTIAGCVIFGGVVGLAIYFAAPILFLYCGVIVSMEAAWTCAAIASFIAASVDIYLKNSEINKFVEVNAAIFDVKRLEEEAKELQSFECGDIELENLGYSYCGNGFEFSFKEKFKYAQVTLLLFVHLCLMVLPNIS
jgi:hypothetical protein